MIFQIATVLYFLIGCFILIFLILGIMAFRGIYLTVKFRQHLKQHHYEKWEFVTTVMGSAGLYNTRRFVSFIFSPEDLGDLKAMDYKMKLKKLYLNYFIALAAEFVILIVSIILAFVLSRSQG